MKKTQTERAYILIERHNKRWLCDKLGITPHTLYRRLAEHTWKQSEIFVIDDLFVKQLAEEHNG